jgi:hypothetical protein
MAMCKELENSENEQLTFLLLEIVCLILCKEDPVQVSSLENFVCQQQDMTHEDSLCSC